MIRSRTALLLLLVVLGYIHVKWIHLSATQYRTSDFAVYYIAAEAISRGENPYGMEDRRWDELAHARGVQRYTRPYYYPPLTALMVRTFSFLDPVSAATVWLSASALAFALSALLLARTSKRPESYFLAFGLVGGFFPVLDTLSLGQANAFLLLALCAAYYSLQRGRRFWTGFWIAVGIHVKIVPVVHLGAFAVGRRWRIVAATLLSGALLVGLGIVVLGWNGGLGFLGAEAKAGSSGLITYHSNQALSGPIARGLEGHPLMALWLWRASVAATLLATAALCWKRVLDRRLFALVTISANLVLPYTWYHQLCLLLIPLHLLVEEAVERRDRRWRLIPLTAGYVVTGFYGLYMLNWINAGYPLSLPFFLCLFCWILLVKDIRSEGFTQRRRGAEGGGRGE